MEKIHILYFAFQMAFCSCYTGTQEMAFEELPNGYRIEKVSRLPAEVRESSGLARYAADSTAFWTHSDSNNPAELYAVSEKGKLLKTLPLPGVPNNDWEDLAQDEEGNLYVGDIGNNANTRTDLAIYRLGAGGIDRIGFSYADQDGFPSAELRFDCEAMFYHRDSLYLITKSYAPKKHPARMYVLPATPGQHVARPVATLRTDTSVTAADIHPNGTEFAVLTYGKLLLFTIKNGRPDFASPKACITTKRKQTEAVMYRPDGSLLFTNEQGKIYHITQRRR